MRRAMILVAVLATLMVIPGVANATTLDDYAGEWQATDTDGSSMTMTLRRTGARLQMQLFDDGGNVCDPTVFPTTRTIDVNAKGTGTLQADGSVDFRFRFKCENGVKGHGTGLTLEFIPNGPTAAADAIFEDRGGGPPPIGPNVTWTRVP